MRQESFRSCAIFISRIDLTHGWPFASSCTILPSALCHLQLASTRHQLRRSHLCSLQSFLPTQCPTKRRNALHSSPPFTSTSVISSLLFLQLLDLPCRHRDLSAFMVDNVYIRERMARYLQIRRCSSCRLRRCFEMGMKEALVRTEEENQRYRQLVDGNRKRKEALKQQLLEIKQLLMPQVRYWRSSWWLQCSSKN